VLIPEEGPAFTLVVTVDGVRVLDVVEVAGLGGDGETIELKQQLPDGKYVTRTLPGRPKAGEFRITRELSSGDQPFEWLKAVTGGDVADARATVSVSLVDDDGGVVRSYEYRNCRIASVKAKWPKPGSHGPAVEKIAIEPVAE
jgi:phage tail-like protein